jgi:endogenous inhibitor of DNA gyrase (YacG/DUF329 family)
MSGEKKYSLRTYGPCPTCGKYFESRGRKTFCSLDCYLKSPLLLERLKKQQQLTGEIIKCRECGKEIYKKKSSKKLYCSTACYRKYMSKRFDRWIASPEVIALPQNYDEFLTAPELPCLIEGCGWHGNFLSLHMNFAHGISARDFKKMAGFNLTSGIVSLRLYELMCARPHIKNAKFNGNGPKNPTGKQGDGYISLEGKEHAHKSYVVNKALATPVKIIKCSMCGKDVTVFFNSHNTKFCSVLCRTEYYKTHEKERVGVKLKCAMCSVEFSASASQARRNKKGLATFCSLPCKQKSNAPRGIGSHSTWKNVINKGEHKQVSL